MQKSKLDILLLVEDEPDHAHLIMDVLTEHGHLANQIIWVKDGREAVDYVLRKGKNKGRNSSRPGLILLDIKMPELDGFDVLKILKADDDVKTIPIVMLTTTRNSEDVEKALALGANDYISKPVEWEAFVKTVGELGKYWAFISDANLAR